MKIFTFVAGTWESGDVLGSALAEDGECVAEHLSSSVEFAKYDVGERRRKDFEKKYPDQEIEIEWVEDPAHHDGFQAAYKLNQEKFGESGRDPV